jgi:hypothetical protein
MGADPLTAQHAGFQRAFFDHYYPAAQAGAMERPTDFAERAGRFVGEYRFASAPATTLIKIVELFGAYRAAVTDPGDGSLVLNLGGQNRQFVEVEPLYFRDLTGQFGLVFQEDGAGRITGAYTDLMPQYGLIKLAWYESSRFNMALLLLCTLVFLSIVPIALVRGFRGRAKSGADVGAGGARRAYRLLVVVCLLNGSLTLRGKVVLGVGLAGAVLTIGAVAYSVLAWLRRYWGVAFRVYYTVVSVAAVAFVWFLDYWNLLGWRY